MTYDEAIVIAMKKTRARKGRTQTEVGNAIGMSFQNVSHMERRRRKISLSNAEAMSDYFGVDIVALAVRIRREHNHGAEVSKD